MPPILSKNCKYSFEKGDEGDKLNACSYSSLEKINGGRSPTSIEYSFFDKVDEGRRNFIGVRLRLYWS